MVMQIDRDRVRQLLQGAAVLVDVLPAHEYETAHIPGAIDIPLRTLGRETTRQLDAARPVIAYCHDYQ
jgi:rhodanese-related sulfurtransferase